MNYFKRFLPFYFLLFSFLAHSQEENDGFKLNIANTLSSAATNNVSVQGTTGYFYNPRRAVDGSEYLFDTWENSAVVFTTDNHKFKLKNINLNIKRNSFLSKINKDSIFTFNMNDIEKIVVNNKVYKNIYSEKGKNIYEIVFESDNFSVLKSFYIHKVEGSPNPMLNRKNDRIIRKKKFYVLKNTSLSNFRFSKGKVLALVDSKNISKIKEYVKKENLSYRKEIDVKQILNYNTSL